MPSTTVPSTTAAAATSTPSSSSEADATRRDLLREILASHLAAGEFVGARIAVAEGNGTITEVAAGTQTVDPASAPVDPDVPWNVGSVTKTVLAVVVLQLAQEGLIDLDAGIDEYLPALRDAARITPRQLLQHTSGLGEYIDQPAVVSDPGRPWTPAELIAIAEATGRYGEPGGDHHYSNTNYLVLGEIIQQVTGSSWEAEVRARITGPLGMSDTGVIPDVSAPGYKVVGGSFVDMTSIANPSIGGAAGGMQSTGRDMVRFVRAILDGTLLSPESLAAMQVFVPAEDLSQFGITHGYGLGIEQYTTDAVTVNGHMGTGETGSAFVGYDVDRGTIVVVMTNTGIPGPQAFMAVEALSALTATG